MSDITEKNKRVLRINKPEKLKISATLSALCNKLGLMPIKVLTELKALTKDLNQRLFVELTVDENLNFTLKILEKSDAAYLKSILKQDPEKLESSINSYAMETLNKEKSYAMTLESRIKELRGIMKSF